jgi:N-methylhydantoinase B
MTMSRYDAVSLKILWDRLVAIADEIVLSLVRSAFSINVREGYDLSCVLFDANGASLAQGTFSVPTFTGTAPQTLQHMLRRFPPHTLRPGDAVLTNDSWLGTGHLYDVNVMRPVFRHGTLVGYTMAITHLPDIGGMGFSSVQREMYEEGLNIPLCKILKEGLLNEELIEIIRANVRVQDEVIGDLMANLTCTEVGARALLEFMDEYEVDDLAPLSTAIRDQSEQRMRAQISAIPDGVYANTIQIEGVDAPITLAATVTVSGDEIAIDFSGTGGPVDAAINVPFCYSKALAWYTVKCLTIPELPNNEGAVRPITVTAPAGCILNVNKPYATGGRHSVGHFIVPLLMGALAPALPERVVADVGMMDVFSFQGTHRDGQGVSSLFFLAGGFGALHGKDGLAVVPAPSNMQVVPTEIWENLTSVTVEHRVLIPNSGGPGTFRGGIGQDVGFRNDTAHPLLVAFLGQRTQFPAKGFHGGSDGRKREYRINGETVHPKGRYLLQPNDRFNILEAGGGGFGPHADRPVAHVLDDVANGYVTPQAALADYGVDVATGTRPPGEPR